MKLPGFLLRKSTVMQSCQDKKKLGTFKSNMAFKAGYLMMKQKVSKQQSTVLINKEPISSINNNRLFQKRLTNSITQNQAKD